MTPIGFCLSFVVTSYIAGIVLSCPIHEGRQATKVGKPAVSARIPLAPSPSPAPEVESSSVVGGTKASDAIRKRNAFLYIYHQAQGDFFYCGGSVISERHILTAAHCLFHPTTGEVATGISIYIGDSTLFTSQPFFANALFVHKDYREDVVNGVAVYSDDVAVLELSDEITDDDIEIIELADSDDDIPSAGDLVLGVGFGQTSFGGSLSDVLLQVTLRLQDYETCVDAEPEEFRPFLNDAVSICASDPDFPTLGGRDTCNGDSGGALYEERGEGDSLRIVQVGITSWGSTGCAEAGTVAWYTRLTRYTAALRELVSRGDASADSIWSQYP